MTSGRQTVLKERYEGNATLIASGKEDHGDVLTRRQVPETAEIYNLFRRGEYRETKGSDPL